MKELSTYMTRQMAVRVAVVVILIAVVAPFVIYAVPQVIGANHSYVVLTASMSPAIETGDVVIVSETDPEAVEAGDVITYVRGENEPPVTHRVVEITTEDGQTSYVTQGDANSDPDSGAVPADNLIGAVVLVIPWIGYVIQFINTPTGFALFVLIPIGLLVISEAWTLLAPALRDTQTEPEEG